MTDDRPDREPPPRTAAWVYGLGVAAGAALLATLAAAWVFAAAGGAAGRPW